MSSKAVQVQAQPNLEGWDDLYPVDEEVADIIGHLDLSRSPTAEALASGDAVQIFRPVVS